MLTSAPRTDTLGLRTSNLTASVFSSRVLQVSKPINNPLVEFRDVSFSHAAASAPVISHLNFSVQQGETLVLLGESGCGKTTTLKLINRLLSPSSGEVMVEGKSTTAW